MPNYFKPKKQKTQQTKSFVKGRRFRGTVSPRILELLKLVAQKKEAAKKQRKKNKINLKKEN